MEGRKVCPVLQHWRRELYEQFVEFREAFKLMQAIFY